MTCAAWCTADEVTACPCDDVGEAEINTAIAFASDVLFKLSGDRFPGVCEAVVRPVAPTGYGGLPADRYLRNAIIQGLSSSYDLGWNPGVGWGWSFGCFHGFGPCSCGLYQSVRLGPGPIVSVSEVRVDGAVLTPNKYDIIDDDWLVRTDDGVFPVYQDPRKPATDAGTFRVTYTYGMAPPPGGVHAAVKLACEIAKACSGQECALPERVTSLTRQGMTMTLLDPQTFLKDGHTGIYLVDLFLAAYPRDQVAQRVSVQSPDFGPLAHRRRSEQ